VLVTAWRVFDALGAVAPDLLPYLVILGGWGTLLVLS